MPDATKSKNNNRWLWILATLFLVLVFFGVHRLTRPVLSVRVARAEIQNLTRTRSTNGKVEPQTNWTAPAPAPGVVKKLYVHAGEHVVAGQLLLTMDDSDAAARVANALAALTGAQASLTAMEKGGTQEEQLDLAENISRAQVNVERARKDLATLQQLQSQGDASQNEIDMAEQRLSAAKLSLDGLEKRKSDRYASSELEHAKATLADAQSSYYAARAVITELNVRAPFAGTVYSLPISQTEYVQAGSELLQVADLSRLQVRAYFDEPDIGQLQVGQLASIRWDAKFGRTWSGHVMRLPSTIINYGLRNVGETLISIDDPDGVLLPNVNVTVTVTTERVQNALTIPHDALHRESGKDYVFVVKGNTVQRRAVTTGATNLTQVQILSGLAEGDVVALGTSNGEPLSEGVPIREIQ